MRAPRGKPASFCNPPRAPHQSPLRHPSIELTTQAARVRALAPQASTPLRKLHRVSSESALGNVLFGAKASAPRAESDENRCMARYDGAECGGRKACSPLWWWVGSGGGRKGDWRAARRPPLDHALKTTRLRQQLRAIYNKPLHHHHHNHHYHHPPNSSLVGCLARNAIPRRRAASVRESYASCRYRGPEGEGAVTPVCQLYEVDRESYGSGDSTVFGPDVGEIRVVPMSAKLRPGADPMKSRVGLAKLGRC